MNSHSASVTTRFQRGLSLIELMIAMAIGLLILGAVAMLFSGVSEANREQFKSAQQIENGRFSIDTMVNDLRLAGYYGEFAALPALPLALPDPCAIPGEAEILESTPSEFGLHVQGYSAADLSSAATVSSACAAILDANTLRPGSDVLVIRRLGTQPLLKDVATATPDAGGVYAQTGPSAMAIQYGSAAAINNTMKANGDVIANPAGPLWGRKDFSTSPATRVAQHIRKVHVHVYFVANCRNASSSGQCPTANDGIPTLKRLELSVDAGTRKMTVVPLAEGVEFLRVRYGLDTTSYLAGKSYDASVDSVVQASGISSLADWQKVVMLDLRLLVRNSEKTAGYSDPKSYDLGGSLTYTPSGDALNYRRHAFGSQVYLMNIGGRRES